MFVFTQMYLMIMGIASTIVMVGFAVWYFWWLLMLTLSVVGGIIGLFLLMSLMIILLEWIRANPDAPFRFLERIEMP